MCLRRASGRLAGDEGGVDILVVVARLAKLATGESGCARAKVV